MAGNLVVGMLVAAVAALVVAAVVRRLRDDFAQQGAADRDATVRAAVDSVVAIAADQLGVRAQAGAQELSLHRDAIGQRLTTMGDELTRVSELVGALQRDRAAQHGELVQGLRDTLRTTTELAGTTQALREALASPKARGQWGERMADDVLRAAGLLEGVNYRKQRAIAGGTIPDFTFLLPRDVELHMDVKFPVDNYLRHLEAATDAERDATCSAFLRDVRNRIKELALRGYADPRTTPGFLLLFIPNESVYAFIQEHDRDLCDNALTRGVVLCSPFTLFAVLGVVRQAVDCFLLERASDEILDALTGFSQQWQRFSDHVDKLGKQLGTVQGTYDELATTRRRQLERRLDEIEVIRTRRGLPGLDCDDEEPVDAPETPVLREVRAL
ncbi:MAG TPA: DNA recombination protein RmuC [Acidimicrobiales bacterium]|jgi:DNA recombination protein RmuC|nr:DNA recombination protein RmuC [Acidimicrobiales bacterium]